MPGQYSGLGPFHHDQRSTDPSFVGGDVHGILMMTDEDAHQGGDAAHSPKLAEVSQEGVWLARESKGGAVDEDDVGAVGVQLLATHAHQIFGAGDEDQSPNGRLFVVGGDVGHEGQILDQATGFAFGRIGRAQHPKL